MIDNLITMFYINHKSDISSPASPQRPPALRPGTSGRPPGWRSRSLHPVAARSSAALLRDPSCDLVIRPKCRVKNEKNTLGSPIYGCILISVYDTCIYRLYCISYLKYVYIYIYITSM